MIYQQYDRIRENELNERRNQLKKKEHKKTDLITIPNIGTKIKQNLIAIGIKCVEDLKGKDPEELYAQDCLKKGFQEDRCLLYVFRMAVYYAEHQKQEYEPEKLKWWYWKDNN